MEGEFYRTIRNKSNDYSDRYKNCDILEDLDTGDKLLSTREIPEIRSSKNDVYHRIESHEASRLDNIAHKYYRNPLLWWVIAKANNIYNPFLPLEIGSLIRIPSIETLYGNNGILL